jgi:hypothetical protein
MSSFKPIMKPNGCGSHVDSQAPKPYNQIRPKRLVAALLPRLIPEALDGSAGNDDDWIAAWL